MLYYCIECVLSSCGVCSFVGFCGKGNIYFLLCLNFYSVFDTVDHALLIQQLENSSGISGSCLQSISSYLSNRSSVVSMNKFNSISFQLVFFRVLFSMLLNSAESFHQFLFKVKFTLMTLTSPFRSYL